jgi:hypothetical protein
MAFAVAFAQGATEGYTGEKYTDDIVLEKKNTYLQPFNGYYAFRCKIRNNSKHILRMGDARVVLAYSGKNDMDEVVRAISSKKVLIDRIEDHPEVARYSDPVNNPQEQLLENWEETLNKFYKSRKFTLMSDLSLEIYPGFEEDGFLLFDEEDVGENLSGSISFFDITTSVDNAGNPTTKEVFTFDVSIANKYFKEIKTKSTGEKETTELTGSLLETTKNYHDFEIRDDDTGVSDSNVTSAAERLQTLREMFEIRREHSKDDLEHLKLLDIEYRLAEIDVLLEGAKDDPVMLKELEEQKRLIFDRLEETIE